MVSQVRYYINKIYSRLRKIFSLKRLKKYGFKLAILDFIIFLLRRNNSKFEQYCIREKDKIIQVYLRKEYKEIFEKARGL